MRVITDQASSFNFLMRNNALYEKRGTHKYPLTFPAAWPGETSFAMHNNTIESYWSQLLTWLHASHKVPADYLPLFLSELIYRSLRISLSVTLRPLQSALPSSTASIHAV